MIANSFTIFDILITFIIWFFEGLELSTGESKSYSDEEEGDVFAAEIEVEPVGKSKERTMEWANKKIAKRLTRKIWKKSAWKTWKGLHVEEEQWVTGTSWLGGNVPTSPN